MEELLQELMCGVNAKFLQWMGNVVRHGPFKGMTIPTPDEESWVDGNFSTKVLGSYEFELHDAIAHAVSRKPKTVVNVGCADGYYAIGLARMMPVEVYAYDINQTAADVVRKYAKLNGVADRVEVCCSRLTRSGEGDLPLLHIVDIEGEELEFVDLQTNPRLAVSDLIIECHDFLNKDISLTLANRLANTHSVEIIRPRLPLYSRYEFLSQSPSVMQVLTLTEKRPLPSLWLACWANDHDA